MRTTGAHRLQPSLRRLLILSVAATLAACGSDPRSHGGKGADTTQETGDTRPFAGIGKDEKVYFLGAEPFWGGEAAGGTLIYTTPERPAGQTIAVERFAGRGGLSFSGALDGAALDLTVTPGDCSDTMSDRLYPLTITLSLGGQVRDGCGWTDAQSWRETNPPSAGP